MLILGKVIQRVIIYWSTPSPTPQLALPPQAECKPLAGASRQQFLKDKIPDQSECLAAVLSQEVLRDRADPPLHALISPEFSVLGHDLYNNQSSNQGSSLSVNSETVITFVFSSGDLVTDLNPLLPYPPTPGKWFDEGSIRGLLSRTPLNISPLSINFLSPSPVEPPTTPGKWFHSQEI